MSVEYNLDLHVHTCLSPCGDSRMVPTAIVRQALEVGVDAIAICDHNSTANVASVRKAGERKDLVVLGGMEITSREEIHLLGLFDEESALKEMNDLISRHLSGRNDPEAFGEQWIVNADDIVTGIEERLLMGATDLSVDRIVEMVHRLEGVVIASHVDREAFSVIGQLGFIPDDLDLDAVEVSPHGDPKMYADCGRLVVVSSDAHFLEDIGRRSVRMRLNNINVGELRQSFQAEKRAVLR